MRTIGITGGIGSGKSTVARILHDLGAKIINADKIAREIMYKGGEALKELVNCFGSGILDESGELNRKELARIVFGNPEKLEMLNIITHKYIAQRIYRSVSESKNSTKTGVIVLDAPLPVEKGFLDVCDVVWVVTADRDIRIKRIMQRDGLSYEEAESRINSQMKDEEYLRTGNEAIVNNGNIEELEKEVVRLFFKVQRAQSDVVE